MPERKPLLFCAEKSVFWDRIGLQNSRGGGGGGGGGAAAGVCCQPKVYLISDKKIFKGFPYK